MVSSVPRTAPGRRPKDRRRWPWFFIVPLVLVALAVGMTAWFDRSAVGEDELGAPTRLLVVNDAGPVRVRSALIGSETEDVPPNSVTIRRHDSWLLERPELEIQPQVTPESTAVARVSCSTRFPCRSVVEVFVPDGIDLVVVSTEGLAEVDRFDGSITVYSSGGGAMLGPLRGSARIVSDGPVQGFDLALTDVNVLAADADVDLEFAESPMGLTVEAGIGDVDLVVPRGRFQVEVAPESSAILVEIPTNLVSERVIVIQTEGAVTLSNPS